MLRTCQDILPFGAMFLAFLPVCSVVSLVLRCWVGVLHSYSPFSVSTVLTISSVPNSVILNLRLLPKKTTKFNDVHEGRCGNNRLRKGNFRRQSCPPFHPFLVNFQVSEWLYLVQYGNFEKVGVFLLTMRFVWSCVVNPTIQELVSSP